MTNTTAQPNKRRFFQWTAATVALGAVGSAIAQHRGGDRGGLGGRDPAAMIERRIDHMIKAINGSPEQKAKLTALAQAAAADLKPLREQLMTVRKKGMDLLAEATIDRSAIEKLRAEQVQLADALSRRMATHMADAAEILTPAQRTQLAEKMKSRQEGGRWGRHGDHGGGMGGFWR